jgi:hypothetical protein
MVVNFGNVTETRLDFSPIQVLIFDDFDIPEFSTDTEAIAALGGNQIYKLINTQLVKVTPPTFITNLVLDMSKSFSWLRRLF